MTVVRFRAPPQMLSLAIAPTVEAHDPERWHDGGRKCSSRRRLVGPTLYTDHQSGLDDTVLHGWHYYWKATNLTGRSDAVIQPVPSAALVGP